jgi:hypothetical protein
MNRRVSLFVLFVLALGCTLAGSPARAQAQSFAGKWVHQGPRGTSVLDFFPGEKHVIGPIKGQFHHSIILDDGRVVEGNGWYVFRNVLPNRGWLILHFADGHVTREHEHTVGSTVLRLRAHGCIRDYVRQ